MFFPGNLSLNQIQSCSFHAGTCSFHVETSLHRFIRLVASGSRRILHGINDCLVVQRQKRLNQLIASPTMYLGLETAQQVMLNEQGIDATSMDSVCKHRDDYTDGHKQSGFVELFWSAHVDGKHIVLVSPVSGTSSYAVT